MLNNLGIERQIPYYLTHVKSLKNWLYKSRVQLWLPEARVVKWRRCWKNAGQMIHNYSSEK
jgi:hypothetical protein